MIVVPKNKKAIIQIQLGFKTIKKVTGKYKLAFINKKVIGGLYKNALEYGQIWGAKYCPVQVFNLELNQNFLTLKKKLN